MRLLVFSVLSCFFFFRERGEGCLRFRLGVVWILLDGIVVVFCCLLG